MRFRLAPSLAGLIVFVGLVLLLRAAMGGSPDPDSLVDTPSAGPDAFQAMQPPVVEAADVCPRAGYLCSGLRERGLRRIMRWPDTTTEIEVRVPKPGHVDAGTARELQSAAIRGILAWQNAPFPLRITRSDRPGSEAFAVSWGRRIVTNELGRTATQWEMREGVARMRVREMTLATHSGATGEALLSTDQVMLTAAHEMGHALGLPHSDDERDLMYPTNTAVRLSTRDYMVMEALYRIENGAELSGDLR